MADPDPPRLPAMRAQAEPPAPGPERGYRVRHDGWTGPRKRKFLHALARTGCVRDACALANISTTSAYRYRKRDAGFAEAWERALTEALPVLEAAAFERAVEGVDDPIVQGGKVVTTRKRYSDAILVTLLKRADVAAERTAVANRVDPREAFEELKRRLAVMHRRGCEDPDCRECNRRGERD